MSSRVCPFPGSDNSKILHQLAPKLLQKYFIILLQKHIIVQLLRISPSKYALHMFNGEGEVIASSTGKPVLLTVMCFIDN
jgi:hypothetical protein